MRCGAAAAAAAAVTRLNLQSGFGASEAHTRVIPVCPNPCSPPDGPEATSPPACALGSLEPDGFAAVCEHLQHDEVAALASSCAALRHAVASNDRLWSR